MTTAVFFDLDGTLLQYTESFPSLFSRTLPAAPEGAYEYYLESLFTAFDDLSTRPYTEAFAATVAEFELDSDPHALAAAYVEHELAATSVSEEAYAAVERVAARRPTGILTNGAPEMQHRKIERHGLDALTRATVVSNDPVVAARKPDGEIFAVAEDELPADSYVYVGDTYDEDVLGAQQAGWKAIHVGSDGPNNDRENTVPTRVSVASAVERILD